MSLVVDNLVERYAPLGSELLSTLSESQKDVLYAIATDRVATAITSGAFIKRHRLLSTSAVQSASQVLLKRGLVSRRGDEYRVSDPLLGHWLRRLIIASTAI
ncbi:MAG: hypothetical protein IJ835_06400 [Muribaculaceae bacterium]|nr:hypothetical protein [Muribaculaceae bacterium]